MLKSDTAPKRFIREFRNVNVDEYEVGQEVSVDTSKLVTLM